MSNNASNDAGSNANPNTTSSPAYRVGQRIMYRHRDGYWKESEITEIDRSLDPPAYTVRIQAANGEYTEINTEATRILPIPVSPVGSGLLVAGTGGGFGSRETALAFSSGAASSAPATGGGFGAASSAPATGGGFVAASSAPATGGGFGGFGAASSAPATGFNNNPFQPRRPSPFGAAPSASPFGAAPSASPFGAAPSASPFGNGLGGGWNFGGFGMAPAPAPAPAPVPIATEGRFKDWMTVQMFKLNQEFQPFVEHCLSEAVTWFAFHPDDLVMGMKVHSARGITSVYLGRRTTNSPAEYVLVIEAFAA